MKAPPWIRFILLFVMVLVMAGKLYAQQHGLKLYNVNDGLPNTLTHVSYQDKYGYLWIGTPSGVSRFDGRQFVNYGISDGLPSLNVGKIFQDSRGRLWIGTAAGMAQFKNDRFITYPTNDNLNNNWVFNFFETKDKRLLALTTNGAYEFADTVWKKIALYPGFTNRTCREVVEANGELYVCYPSDIVCRDKDGKWLHIASQHTYGSIFNVLSFQQNKIWVSTISNIYEINNHKLIPLYKQNISAEHYFSYLFDSKNRLWLAGDDFLKISEPGDWQHFTASINQYSHAAFINEDSSHNIWIGTMEGLLKIKDIDFTVADKNNKDPLDGIYNIIPLPDNKLLFSSGTKTGLLLYEDGRCKQIMPPPGPGNEDYYRDPVDAYTFDDQNTLWMVTRFKRFLHFNGKTLEDFTGALHLKTTEHIYDMIYAKKRKVFFACADSTLLYGKHSNFFTFIPHNTGVPIVKPTRVREIKNGLMLIYVDGIGVYAINQSNNLFPLLKETHIDGSKKGIQLGVIFYEDTGSGFWIAVPGLGLYEYGFAKNQLPFLKNHITVKDGLQSNDILSLTNDLKNRLWIATNKGVDILQKNKAGNWEIFNYAGVQDLTLNITTYLKLILDKKGNVWLSSPQKIIKFNPAGIKLYKEIPHIIIEKVSLAFKETDWRKFTGSLYSYYQLPYNPVLNYNQNSLGIFFNAADISTSNSNPQYAYKLLPLDTSWSNPSKINSVSFAQLPEGKYQFILKAKDQASGWSRPAVFRFTITPPFWNEWWFRLIIIVFAAFIIIRIFEAREKKIKNDAYIENQLRELEMKALKAQMNPHFIYNALNSIQALVANNKKNEGIHYIGSFSRLLRQVLDNSENNVISLDKELETIGLYIQLESLRLDMQLQYKKIIPQNIVAEFEKIPPLILQPFVENSLWHGLSHKEGEKEIKITVSLTDEWLLCDITDNGMGRKKARERANNSIAIHQSKGIQITTKRLIDFNRDSLVTPVEFFDLHDENDIATGTRVIVRIKRKFASPAV